MSLPPLLKMLLFPKVAVFPKNPVTYMLPELSTSSARPLSSDSPPAVATHFHEPEEFSLATYMSDIPSLVKLISPNCAIL